MKGWKVLTTFSWQFLTQSFEWWLKCSRCQQWWSLLNDRNRSAQGRRKNSECTNEKRKVSSPGNCQIVLLTSFCFYFCYWVARYRNPVKVILSLTQTWITLRRGKTCISINVTKMEKLCVVVDEWLNFYWDPFLSLMWSFWCFNFLHYSQLKPFSSILSYCCHDFLFNEVKI